MAFQPGLEVGDERAAYWFRQVCVRLRRELLWLWQGRGTGPGTDAVSGALDLVRHHEAKLRFFETDETARHLTALLEEPIPGSDMSEHSDAPERGSLGWVERELGLDEASLFVLALALLPRFDSASAAVMAACMEDASQTYPTLALAQRLWDEPHAFLKWADPWQPLFRYGLLTQRKRAPHGAYEGEVGLSEPLSVPALVANQLLYPCSSLPTLLGLLDRPSHSEGKALAQNLQRQNRARWIWVVGRKGSSFRDFVAETVGREGFGVAEFRGDPRILETPGQLSALSSLCWLKGVDLFLGEDAVPCLLAKGATREWLPGSGIPATIFAAIGEGAEGWEELIPQADRGVLRVPRLSYEERRAEWERALGDRSKELGEAVAECSRRFRFERGTILKLGAQLKSSSGGLTREELMRACREERSIEMRGLAEPVTPRFQSDELILPSKQSGEIEEIYRAIKALTEVHYGWGAARAWNEAGVSVLFSGVPGTGKTMAAEVLAARLSLPLYRVDLSQIVNKYVGETEKNLKRVFDAADDCDCILFFDEADSLFGRRTEVRDSHDRYANLEVSYLLERMERFKGVAILATNRKRDLDDAFLRRLRYVVEFPLPEAAERKELWRRSIPPQAPCDPIDFEFLAQRFPVSGGHIRSIVFNAALQAAGSGRGRLGMPELIEAARREMEKLNRSTNIRQAHLALPREERGVGHAPSN